MDLIERAVQNSNPGLYKLLREDIEDHYQHFQDDGLNIYKSAISNIYELNFYSNGAYMLSEILDQIYLKEWRGGLKYWESSTDLAAYLSSTGFQDEHYALAEYMFFVLDEEIGTSPSSYTLGYASTEPVIVDFIQAISLKTSVYDLYIIEVNLVEDPQSISRTLRKGVSYDLMAAMLLKRRDLRILDLYPSIVEDEKVCKLFLELSNCYNNPIPVYTVTASADSKDFLARLAYLSERMLAIEKLLIMIHFPEDAQIIFNYPTVFAFGIILLKKLTKWRRKVAMKLDWKGSEIGKISLMGCRFKYTKNYYPGYRENSMLDDLIGFLSNYKDDFRINQMFVSGKMPKNFFQRYRKNVMRKEFQGTVYSILRDDRKFEWDPVDPLSEEINPNYENEFLSSKWVGPLRSLRFLWFESKYIDMMSKIPIPISRLVFNSRYSANDFIIDDCMNDQGASVKVTRDIYESLAYYFQPRVGYQDKWDSYARDCELDRLAREVWQHNIKHCNIGKSFEIITKTLREGQVDLLTKNLLLHILEDVAKEHFPEEKALRMDFTEWTDPLRHELSAIFGALHKSDSRKDDDNNILPKRRRCCGCIVA